MISRTVTALFWLCVLAVLHPYVVYPCTLWLAGLVTGEQSGTDARGTPSVALAIAAYNEREVIERKLQNSFALEYPDEKLHIAVLDDGSTDGTDDIVRSYADRGVELYRVEGRVGKTACQNAFVADAEADVVVFSDADSMYDADAVRRLVDRFEPGVGCVVGDLRHRSADRIVGECVYWRFEQWLKRLESRVSTTVTGTGAIYGVRRSSYVPLPADAVSDFALPLAILERGERVAYAPGAVARERMSGDLGLALDRRLRIAARVWRTGLRRRALCSPLGRPLVAYQLLSHRVLQAAAPLAVCGLLVTSAVLVATDGGVVPVAVLALLSGVGVLAGVGAILHGAGRALPSVVGVPYYLARAGVDLFRGLSTLRRDGAYTTWETVDRAEPGHGESPSDD